MNYGFPQIGNELKKLKSKGCEKILIFPMYPQYSATTTASVIDNVNRYLTKERWQPTLRFVPPYYDDEIYIDAIYKHIKKNLKQKKLKTKKNSLFISWDTKKIFLQGDPYHCHCAKTVRLLNEKFKKEKVVLEMSFQSRFGPQEWLKPYMQEKMDEFIEKKQNHLIVIAPGFSVDCLETLEEIEIQGNEEFKEKGGETFNYINCLNDTEISINMYFKIIQRELLGWI